MELIVPCENLIIIGRSLFMKVHECNQSIAVFSLFGLRKECYLHFDPILKDTASAVNESPSKNPDIQTPLVAKNEKQLPAAFSCQDSSKDAHYLLNSCKIKWVDLNSRFKDFILRESFRIFVVYML